MSKQLTDAPEEVVVRESIKKTKFLQWMRMNQVDEGSCQFTAVDFPTKYVWNSKERICFAKLTTGERCYLRFLMNHVGVAKYYEDLREFNGRVYNTFKEACIAGGLLEDDGEWHECP